MSWPYGNTGPTLAELVAHFKVDSPSLSPGLYQRHDPDWSRVISQIAPEVTDYLRRSQSDQIANQLMQQEGIGAGGGADGLKMAQLVESLKSNRDYNSARIDHLNRIGQNGQASGQGGTPSAPQIDPQTGAFWNGRQWVQPRQPRVERPPSSKVDRYMGLNPELARTPNYTKYVDEKGNPLSTEQADANPDAAFAQVPGKKPMPYAQFKLGLNEYLGRHPESEPTDLDRQADATKGALDRYNPRGTTKEGAPIGNSGPLPQNADGVTVGQPSHGVMRREENPTNPVNGSQQLDRATADAIMREVGGDRTKARELARQRGYIF